MIFGLSSLVANKTVNLTRFDQMVNEQRQVDGTMPEHANYYIYTTNVQIVSRGSRSSRGSSKGEEGCVNIFLEPLKGKFARN